MDDKQLERIRTGKGFIAALDQSGGSTPKALAQYGISESSYSGEEAMYVMVHAMRSRIITSPAFTGERILGVILFENTMNRSIEGMPTADYLWNRKGIVPFLKVDQGLAEERDGVQLMRPMSGLGELLRRAREKNIFGTKMRSVIHEANPAGIAAVMAQQFEVAEAIVREGLVPIIEPEVSIHSPSKARAEALLKEESFKRLAALGPEARVMFKVSIPEQDDFYADLMQAPQVVRVVALSGGYDRKEADARLARNHGLIASFSRALVEGLAAGQSDAEFDAALAASIEAIYNASIT